ncbi:MAG: Xaa-Pro aminopeptidase [Methylococcales bacterium]|nr:Xaa-Pro aminopeptidase [Methylococcales bacterium]
MKQTEFEKRRKNMMAQIGHGNIGLIPSATDSARNRDVDYPFRQDSDFYYLTGFNESGALAVFLPGREQGEYILFCREFDEKKKLWEGAHSGLEGATLHYGADDSFPIDDLNDILPSMLENKGKVFYPMGRDSELDHHLLEWINHLKMKSRNGASAPGELVSLEHILHEMRLFKSAAELKLMRKAAQISAQAHIRAMKTCKVGLYEYQIEAEIIYELMQSGLRAVAYPSIVAGGKNACILHYINNESKLRKNDLLLIDAGGECDHYAADITRTFPVSGKFSLAQKQLYQLVLDVQLAAIERIKPGVSWNDIHQMSIRMMTVGLIELGLLKGNIDTLIKDEKYKEFYMHRLGHWLGMDVHDVGDYKIDDEWRVLEEGMVLTVEPGVYVQADCDTVAAKWRGIGIRIEDDILVTKQGYEVLSADAPKTIAEIETLMQAS